MFNKKITLLFITLFFMLSISAVAAVDSGAVSDELDLSDSEEEPPSGTALVPQDIISTSQDDYSLETRDVSMYYKNGTRYSVTLTHFDDPVENASVIISLNGVNYTRITDSNGVASLAINLIPGNYSISAFYNYDSKLMDLNSDVEVLSTLVGNDIQKIYKNDTQYYISVLDNFGNPLANSDITFNINGVFYNRKTNENGIARLNINLLPDEYILTAIHQNGLSYSNKVTVLPSISGSDIFKIYKNDTQYYASFLNTDGSPLADTEVTFNINGVFYSRMTDADGVAKLNINLDPSSYILTAINPVNNDMHSDTIVVLPSVIASDIESNNSSVKFKAILINSDASVGSNRDMEIIVDNTSYIVRTDKMGFAELDLDLENGIHNVLSHDFATDFYASSIINVSTVKDNNETLYYSIYGVSPDNKTIMAIGRPSASGELSEYGYKFYMTVFERVCPYCGSTELYWGIFWTGDETSNYGVFPATGQKEGGSAEGHIFCANCDADWSVFGNEHVSSGRALEAISESVLSSKDAAYALKNGEMIYS
ncbi:adhesin [uncultured Methanobrevibacter sp.]|uniref:adhesin n=1 Tax=uncultured Methanobrevibacter sp. TaxID=253161 RepID=UPI0025CE1FD6|nr:adhesin [uncultured Methanobrevibacter sp.]